MSMITKAARAGGGPAAVRAAVATLAALSLAVATAACSSGGQTGATGTEKIDDLVVDVLNEPDSLDPMYRDTPEAERFYRLVYSTLLRWKEDKSTVPDLAAAMPEVSADRLTYRIKLREGVTFHDGTPLTAEDVVYSYRQAALPGNGSVWLSALSYMKSVEAEGDLTVVLKLTRPYAYLESRLAMIPVLSSERKYQPNETYAKTANGSGPYRLEKVSRGDSITLRRSKDYYAKAPGFSTITFKVVPENAARLARLAGGDSHILPGLPGDQVKLARSRGQNAKTVESNVSRLFAYPSMGKGRPTTDTDFRLALAWAVDRKAIVDQVYHGAGRPNSTYLTYGSLYHDEDKGLRFGERPDIEKAKAHLAKAGGPPKRKLSIIAYNQPDIVSAATIIQGNLKEIGVDATVEAQEVAAFYPKMVSGEYDLILYNSPASISTGFAPDYVNGGLNSKSASNFNGFADAELDKLLDTALTAPREQQEAAWHAVQDRDLEVQGNIQLVISQNSEAWSKSLKGYQPSSLAWLNTLLPAE